MTGLPGTDLGRTDSKTRALVDARGRIRAVLGGSMQNAFLNKLEDEVVLEVPKGSHPLSHYVDGDQIRQRPVLALELPATVAVGQVLVLDLPPGATVELDGNPAGQADAEGIELQFQHAGRYLVEIDAYPARLITAIIEAL